MRIFLVVILLQSFVFIINAQYLIKGRVLDRTQNGVPYSTIQLTLTDSTFVKGEVADSLGNFLLKDIQKGNYLLRISAMGYKTQIESININSDKVLPPCILKESEVVLNDVVITGTSFIQKKDHLLVIPDKQSQKHAFGGYDLLYNLMIPGVTVPWTGRQRKCKVWPGRLNYISTAWRRICGRSRTCGRKMSSG